MNLHNLSFSVHTVVPTHLAKTKEELEQRWREDFNAIIETPCDSSIKYEIDEETGALKVDRLLPRSVKFPINYGFAPQTLCDDGDALDVMVYTPGYAMDPKSVVRCRPIGVMYMEDEAGVDNKILAVPIDSVWQMSKSWRSIEDLDPFALSEIVNFFNNYKKLIPGKWAKVNKEWGGVEAAHEELQASLAMYRAHTTKHAKVDPN